VLEERRVVGVVVLVGEAVDAAHAPRREDPQRGGPIAVGGLRGTSGRADGLQAEPLAHDRRREVGLDLRRRDPLARACPRLEARGEPRQRVAAQRVQPDVLLGAAGQVDARDRVGGVRVRAAAAADHVLDDPAVRKPDGIALVVVHVAARTATNRCAGSCTTSRTGSSPRIAALTTSGVPVTRTLGTSRSAATRRSQASWGRRGARGSPCRCRRSAAGRCRAPSTGRAARPGARPRRARSTSGSRRARRTSRGCRGRRGSAGVVAVRAKELRGVLRATAGGVDDVAGDHHQIGVAGDPVQHRDDRVLRRVALARIAEHGDRRLAQVGAIDRLRRRRDEPRTDAPARDRRAPARRCRGASATASDRLTHRKGTYGSGSSSV
jgi:hypothetical protein